MLCAVVAGNGDGDGVCGLGVEDDSERGGRASFCSDQGSAGLSNGDPRTVKDPNLAGISCVVVIVMGPNSDSCSTSIQT